MVVSFPDPEKGYQVSSTISTARCLGRISFRVTAVSVWLPGDKLFHFILYVVGYLIVVNFLLYIFDASRRADTTAKSVRIQNAKIPGTS